MKNLIISIISVTLLFGIAYILLSYVFLWPGVYQNNVSLGKEVNSNIKSLVLSDVKNRCSSIFTTSKDTSFPEKSWLVMINPNFMKTTIKKSEYEYTVNIKSFPSDWTIYYTIQVIDSRYIITKVEIDG